MMTDTVRTRIKNRSEEMMEIVRTCEDDTCNHLLKEFRRALSRCPTPDNKPAPRANAMRVRNELMKLADTLAHVEHAAGAGLYTQDEVVAEICDMLKQEILKMPQAGPRRDMGGRR